MNLFFRKRKYVQVSAPAPGEKKAGEKNPWVKCPACGKPVYEAQAGLYKICPQCKGYLRLTAWERIAQVADPDTFQEWDPGLTSGNPLSYPDYEEKLQALYQETGLREGVVTGRCSLGGVPCALCVMDARFVMGSMGSVVGEKLTRAFEAATAQRLPVVVFTVSGGARMQEGILSLMQMAKVSAAVAGHSAQGLLYVTVLTDPTTGGVTASFAMQGDVILAEPRAVVGFAGRRVIEQTIRQTLPPGFQTAEFLLEHGFVDKIVERPNLRAVLETILHFHR
jgi:acetyl-CoA carboxylase carboxyl transferase subunit beta